MKKVIRLTESDLMKIVKRVINEQSEQDPIKTVESTIYKFCSRSVNKSNNLDWAVKNLHDAIYGLGTNLSLIQNAIAKLKTMTNFCQVVNEYKEKYKVSLLEDLRGEIDPKLFWYILEAFDTLEGYKPAKPKIIFPTTCSELNGKSFTYKQNWKLVQMDFVPYYSNKTNYDPESDIYAYAELWNDKVCYCIVGKNGNLGPNSKWLESTDNKQKQSIRNKLWEVGNNNSDSMSRYEDKYEIVNAPKI